MVQGKDAERKITAAVQHATKRLQTILQDCKSGTITPEVCWCPCAVIPGLLPAQRTASLCLVDAPDRQDPVQQCVWQQEARSRIGAVQAEARSAGEEAQQRLRSQMGGEQDADWVPSKGASIQIPSMGGALGQVSCSTLLTSSAACTASGGSSMKMLYT